MNFGAAAGVGIFGGLVASLFGGWDSSLTTLVIFMGIDYITGMIVAAVFQNSSKSESGSLESRAGWRGICRKGMTFFIILIAYRLDLLMGTKVVRDSVVIGYISNEVLSIIENMGLMGVPIPPVITRAIEVLSKKQEDDKNLNPDAQSETTDKSSHDLK